MMTRFFLYLSVVFFLLCSAGVHADTSQRYFTLLPDVPMIEGMEEIETLNFIFDKAEGRVVETGGFIPLTLLKSSAITAKDVEKFYADGLPHLGWKALKAKVFTRNAEQLIVTIEQAPQGLRVKIRLSPLSR